MVGGLTKRGELLAAIAAGLLASAGTAPAHAADLGGDCCADLEERIAELEATTARKGNRKVSLEIYGQVNQSVIWWDDGEESNAYVVTNDNARTRFGFRGKAKINADWEAGYRLEIGVRSANSKRFNQDNPNGNDFDADVGLDLRDSYWYVKNKGLGTVSVGSQATSTDQITEINLTQTKDFAKYSDVEDTGLGLLLRSAVNGDLTAPKIGATGVSGLTWRRLIGDGGDQPGEGERRFNAVTYVTPEFAGFTASASWGEDDYWDAALRYAGEFAGLNVAAGVGYGEITDNSQTKTVCAAGQSSLATDTKCHQFGGSISVIHESSGLFVNAGAGVKVDDNIENTTRFAGTGVSDEQTFWSIQAGIEKKFNEFGKTTIYGEYYDYEGGGNNRRAVDDGDALDVFAGANPSTIWDSGVQIWGVGLAQGFDKAALVLYLSYRHVEGDLVLRQLDGPSATGVANGAIASSPIDDLDLVQAGGIIKF
jgi:predicted porin